MKALRFVPMLALLSAGAASAATFTVTTTDDTGDGSLRDALTQAAASAGPHTITITATGTIAVTSSLPDVFQPTAITGPGAASLTIQGGEFRLIRSRSDFTVSGVTISGVHPPVNFNGIEARLGTLAFTDVTFTGNTIGALGFGLVSSTVPTVVTRCLFTGNTSPYAILFLSTQQAANKILETSFIDNTGMAIVHDTSNSVLTIERSTFTNNRSEQGVGGIQLQGTSTANIFNSTFSGNIGSIASDFFTVGDPAEGVFNLTNVTAHGGSAPSVRAPVNARNTIFSGAGVRCFRAITSQGHNLSSDATCGLTAAGDLETTDPLLGPLADNGGATPSHMMLAGSPALEAGDSTDPIGDVDQRGLPRLRATTVDIGAIEAAPPIITTQPAAQDVAAGAALTLTVVATNPNSAAALTYQWRKDGADIAGATADTYAVASAQAGDAGSYDVVVRNELLGVTSAPAAVTVDGGDGGDGGGDSGGCCNVPGAPAGSTLALAAVVLGWVIRRRRT